MDIRSVDLNLLVVLDALLRTSSVSRTGDELHMSQPAVSAALARLRKSFGDPLFVRSSHAMQPTRASACAFAARRARLDQA